MHPFVFQIYRIAVPKYFRTKILEYNLPIAIQKYYSGLSEPLNDEIKTALNYLKNNPISVFPYNFQDEYSADKIEVHYDSEKQMRYVLLDGKKLYFKKHWGKKKIQNLYSLLSKEQDIRSPHRYLTEQFRFEQGEILVDVGAAEGNFALSIVEKASRLILFEADEEWIEPLKATFEPWKEKVEIVNKYVGSKTDEKNTTLDDFLSNSKKGIFLKIDVEGAESSLLSGSKRILSEQKPIKIAICTYHKQDDEKEFNLLLSEKGFKTAHSDGYMLFYYDKQLKAPYFRRGLIRAEKS